MGCSPGYRGFDPLPYTFLYVFLGMRRSRTHLLFVGTFTSVHLEGLGIRFSSRSASETQGTTGLAGHPKSS